MLTCLKQGLINVITAICPVIVKDAIPFYRVVCAIVRHPEDADSFLTAQRYSTDSTLPNLWEFPGGKIEPGESEEHALIREIKEELGMTIMVCRKMKSYSWTYPSFRIQLIPFLCKTSNPRFEIHCHQDVQWIPLKDLEHLDWAPADVPIVDDLLKG